MIELERSTFDRARSSFERVDGQRRLEKPGGDVGLRYLMVKQSEPVTLLSLVGDVNQDHNASVDRIFPT
ncbi:hypothetical protein [Bradyrhizobium sp. CB2312]|uniref:hypothetical protein n=1 Tax=Bradyrhizobium sp. CB2312 TaxID=3039155 RepID=UPI0024B1D836|nr:hypothetical protein [Bradyrhizobium sp. CB2312]WFU75649.1 hypothetical protein QA642_17530 [Bradyrhizobium sp. CB2312]